MTNNAGVGDIDDDLFDGDGWDDDDVDLGDEGEVEVDQHVHAVAVAVAAVATPANHNVADESGWNDDDDDLDFGDDIDDKQTDGLEQRYDGTTGDDTTRSQLQQQQQPKHHRTPQEQQLYEDLEAYLKLLPHLQTSVNAIFDAEYNASPQQASDVFQYYQERPGLLDYTLEKELPRMDYTIIVRNDNHNNTNTNTDEDPDHHSHHHHPQQQQKTVLQNKTPETSMAVKDCLRRHGMNNNASTDGNSSSSSSSMQHVLPRAANQSLLADLLQVLTGPDRVIRPQYMATAVATSCHFVVDLGGGGHYYYNEEDQYLQSPPPSVRVTAELSLSLPTSNSSKNGGRWKVADMTVVAQLILPHSPEEPPVIDYRLASIRPIYKSHDNDDDDETYWQENLASIVALLVELDMGLDHDHGGAAVAIMEDSNTSNKRSSHLHYRDAFLQQSQSFLENSAAVAVSMKSVLQDIDAVSGLSQKWAALPQLLPSTDLLLEQEAHAEHWQQQQQQQRPPAFHPQQQHPMHRVPPPPPPQQQQQQQQQQRPQSILGGMLGKLAKAVALPEEDPDMYRDWQTTPVAHQQQQQQQQQQRPLVPAAAAPSSGPQLYQRERPPPSAPAPGRMPPTGPSWSQAVQPLVPADRRNPPPPPTPPRAAAAAVQEKLSTSPLDAPPVQDEITEFIDGWDDYDDALESENGDNDDEMHVNSTVRSEMEPETKPIVKPAVPVAYAKTHGQQQLVDINRPIVDKHTINTPSRVVAPSPLPPPLPPPPPQPAVPTAFHDNGIVHELEEEDPEWVGYNAEDDCLPTRRRWRNPRPGGPRQLAFFSASTSAS